MKTIGIILCDNDYANTFKPLLKAVKVALEWNPEASKSEIETMIREGVPFFYCAYQDRKNVLVPFLEGLTVMFDEELTDFIQDNDHDSGSWFLDGQSGAVESF